MSVHIQEITGRPSVLNKKEFSISPYSPVFVGSGQKLIHGLDFIRKGGLTYQLDLKKLFAKQIDDLTNLESALQNAYLGRYLEENQLPLDVFTKQVWPGDCKSGEIMEPIKDGFGYPIIPGSSLKGSIRTALFAYLFDKEKLSHEDYKKLITNKRGSALSNKWASQPLQNKLLSTYHGGKNGSVSNYDVGRALQVADVSFIATNMEVFNLAVLNETREGYQWKQMGGRRKNTTRLSEASIISVAGISYDVDLTDPQDMSITINEKILEDIGWKTPLTHSMIANSCNKLSKKLLEMDLAYLEAAKQDFSELSAVIDDLEAILDTVKECEADSKKGGKLAWMQRIGWGSGWHAMTGAHMYSDNSGSEDYIDIVKKVYSRMFKRTGDFIFPKTRKIVLDRSGKPATSMGWVLVEQK